MTEPMSDPAALAEFNAGTARARYHYEDAYRHTWRRDGLILRPVGVTAEDRFGDVIRERTAQRALLGRPA